MLRDSRPQLFIPPLTGKPEEQQFTIEVALS